MKLEVLQGTDKCVLQGIHMIFMQQMFLPSIELVIPLTGTSTGPDRVELPI